MTMREKQIRDPEARTSIGNAANDFVSGAVLGAYLSTFSFSINVVKSQMQKQLGGESKKKIGGSHAFFRDNQATIFLKSAKI